MLSLSPRSSGAPLWSFLLVTLLATAALGATTGSSGAAQIQAGAATDILSEIQRAETSSSSTSVSASENDAINSVLSGYYEAFGRDPAAASAFYGEPTVIVAPNQIVLLNGRGDVDAFFGKLVASLKLRGYSHSRFDDRRIKLLTPTTALSSGIAIRLKADGTEMQRSGFTYLLHKSNAGWRIHEIIVTDLDKLLAAD